MWPKIYILLIFMEINILDKKSIKGRFEVLERAKVSQEMADFISRESLKQGCSRSQVIRDALDHYMNYEASVVLEQLKEVKKTADDIQQRLQAMGQYEEGRFDQLLKAIKAYRK